MSPQELEKYIIDIVKTLGELNGKATAMCSKLDKTENRLNNLPCKEHQEKLMKEVSDRVKMKTFLTMLTLLAGIVLSGFAYTHSVESAVDNHLIQHPQTVYHKIDK